MAETVKIPGMGNVDKKWVYAGTAVVAGIVIYAYWSYSRRAAEEPTTSDYTGEAIDGTDYAGTDYAYDGSVGEYTGATGSQPPVYTDTNPLPSTNAEWATQAVDKLTDIGYEAVTASAAIGKYLARLDLTEAQADIVRQAVALLGPPPTGDFPIKVAPVTPTTPTDPPTTPTGSKGANLPAPTGLTTWGNGPSRLTVPLKWNPVPGAAYYRVYRKGVAYNIGSSEDTQITIGGLQPNTSYTFHVRAMGDDGKYGPASATKTVKTKK